MTNGTVLRMEGAIVFSAIHLQSARVCATPLLRRLNPEHVRPVVDCLVLVDRLGLLPLVKAGPDVVPRTLGCAL